MTDVRRLLRHARELIGGREIALAVDGGITKENVELAGNQPVLVAGADPEEGE